MKWLWIGLISLSANARWLTLGEAPSVVEKLYMDIDVHKDGTFSQEVEYLTRVQSEDAKVNASIFTIDYNAATDQVEVLEAYTKNGNVKIPVDKKTIEDRDKGESRDYDAIKTRSVVYPQVQIGSALYIKYRISTAKAIIKDRWSTELSFGPSVHTKDMRTRIRSEMPLYLETNDPKKMLTVSQSGNKIEVKNRKTIPGWVHAEKDPFFHPNSFSVVYVSSEKSWNKYMSAIEADYAKILNAGLPVKLKPWINLAETKTTDDEKLKFILEKMSQEFRYFGDWRRHDGGLVPRPLKEIEQSRYGDCKDLSALLVAILRSLKMDARLALVRRGENPFGEEPDYNTPTTNRFNHAIVNVKSGAKTYWLDPTNPVASLAPYPDISGRPSWVMDEKGGTFERLPKAEVSDFEHIHNYSYRFNVDDVAVKVSAQLKRLAPYRIANELLLTSKSEVLSGALEYFTEGAEVQKFDYKKEPKTGRTLKDMDIELDYTAGQVAYNAGKSMFWVIPDGVLEGPFYETENRESDLRLSETPFTFRGTRRLVGVKLAQEAPPACEVKSAWMDMERKVRSEGRDVVIEQRFDLKKPYITHEEYRSPAFRKLQAETKRCFHRTGVLIQSSYGSA